MLRIPPSGGKRDFEKVVVDDWVPGVIQDIEFEENRNSGFLDKESGEPIIYDAVRFVFALEGYKFPHKSNWMRISMHEKSNLAKKYLSSLVEKLDPSKEFDLERLKGMKVKVMFENNGDYQNVSMLRPVDKKLDASLPF